MQLRIVLLFVGLLGIVVSARMLHAQCPTGWLPGEGIPGTDHTVFAFATFPDGDIIVGGAFTTAGRAAASRVARYSPATNTWSALGGLGAGVSSYVNAVAVLSTLR